MKNIQQEKPSASDKYLVATVVKGEILEHTKDPSSMDRKVWLKYTFGGAESFTKIFRVRKARVATDEKYGIHFTETISHERDGSDRIFGTTVANNPPIKLRGLTRAGKKKIELEYFDKHIPEKILFPPDFPHKECVEEK